MIVVLLLMSTRLSRKSLIPGTVLNVCFILFVYFLATINDNTSVDGSHGSSERLQRSKTLTSSVASELSSLVSFESGFDDGSSVVSTMTEGLL